MTDNLKRAEECGAIKSVGLKNVDMWLFTKPELDLYTAKVIKEALKQRDEERDSRIHIQDIAIEQKDAEIAQLREQLAAYEAQPVVQICQLTPGKWTHLIERPHSTANLDAIKQEVRDKALEDAAKVCDSRYMGDNNREDLEARRCAEAIRAMKGCKS